MQPQWMAPEILRNEPSNEKFVSAKPELQVFYFRIISKWFNWINMALSSCDCEQVWCVQLWCHPMGVNDRVHSMEQLKRLTGLIFSQLNTSTFYFSFETSNFVVHFQKFPSEKVVGVVGFMDKRLELPDGLDPQVASIIQDCWKR